MAKKVWAARVRSCGKKVKVSIHAYTEGAARQLLLDDPDVTSIISPIVAVGTSRSKGVFKRPDSGPPESGPPAGPGLGKTLAATALAAGGGAALGWKLGKGSRT